MARKLIGTVTSDAQDKTIVVTVQSRRTHPVYRKQYTVSNKFKAHDGDQKAKIGDKVEIEESRPISKHKHFKLVNIIESSKVAKDEVLA